MLYQVASEEVLKECVLLRKVSVEDFFTQKSSYITDIVKSKNEQPFLVCKYFRKEDSLKFKTSDDEIMPIYKNLISSREVVLRYDWDSGDSEGKPSIAVGENLEHVSSVAYVLYKDELYIKIGVLDDNEKEKFMLCTFMSDLGDDEFGDMRKELDKSDMEQVISKNRLLLELPKTSKDGKSIFVNPNEFLDDKNVFDIYTYGMGVSMDDVDYLDIMHRVKPTFFYMPQTGNVFLDLQFRLEFYYGDGNSGKFGLDSDLKLPLAYDLTKDFISYSGI